MTNEMKSFEAYWIGRDAQMINAFRNVPSLQDLFHSLSDIFPWRIPHGDVWSALNRFPAKLRLLPIGLSLDLYWHKVMCAVLHLRNYIHHL
jgi:hypothetical protein